MYSLNSDKHEMYINFQNKISISPFDDKRYICNDGKNTFPYGYLTSNLTSDSESL